MNARESLTRLKDGNARFVGEYPQNNLHDKEKIKSLVDDQQPYAIILGCADSRVAPEILFDTGLGELFVIRVAGNITNASSIAGIEYAVAFLATKLIVVLGHQNCAAVTNALTGEDFGHNLNHLFSFIAPAIVASGKEATLNEVILNNVKQSVTDLKNKSEIISNAINSGNLKIVPAYYNLDTGMVDFI